MNQNIKLTIPTPCHENWSTMTPFEKGRFCGVCQKNVLDFTNSSDREIAETLAQNDNVCAKVRTSQVNRDLVTQHRKKSAVGAIAATALLVGVPAAAQVKEPVPVEQLQRSEEENYMLGKMIATPVNVLQGTITDENNIAIPDANITIKGTEITAVSDMEGHFSIQAKTGDIIAITYPGYDTEEITVSKEHFIKPNNVILSFFRIGEVVVIKNRTFLGRIFHSIGSIFR